MNLENHDDYSIFETTNRMPCNSNRQKSFVNGAVILPWIDPHLWATRFNAVTLNSESSAWQSRPSRSPTRQSDGRRRPSRSPSGIKKKVDTVIMHPLNISAYRFIVSAILIWILSMRIPIRVYEWIIDKHENTEELKMKLTTWMLLGAIASAYPDDSKRDKTYLFGIVTVALTLQVMCEFNIPFFVYFIGMILLTQKCYPHAVRTVATLMTLFYFSMYHNDNNHHRCSFKVTIRHVLFGCVGVFVGLLSELMLRHADLALSTTNHVEKN